MQARCFILISAILFTVESSCAQDQGRIERQKLINQRIVEILDRKGVKNYNIDEMRVHYLDAASVGRFFKAVSICQASSKILEGKDMSNIITKYAEKINLFRDRFEQEFLTYESFDRKHACEEISVFIAREKLAE